MDAFSCAACPRRCGALRKPAQPSGGFCGMPAGLWLRGRLCISGRSLALVGNTVLEPCFSPAARCAVFIAKTSRSASAAMERW